MVTRERWLAEGVDALRAEGTSGIRIDRLARRLGLTKGSFHHHFAGASDYRRALLAYCCARADSAITDARRRLASLSRSELVTTLPGLADGLHERTLDVALRGWAVEDAEARSAVAAIDGARLAFLEELWTEVLGEPAAARSAALVPHLVIVGASLSPGVRDDDLDEVFRLLSRLAPSR